MPCLGVRERGPVPILGSGYAFVVFPTPADARRALIRPPLASSDFRVRQCR